MHTKNIISRTSDRTGLDIDTVKNVADALSIELKKEILEHGNVKIDDFFDFSERFVKRYCYNSKPENEKGERERELRYYSTTRIKPIGTMKDIIYEVTEEVYNQNKTK